MPALGQRRGSDEGNWHDGRPSKAGQSCSMAKQSSRDGTSGGQVTAPPRTRHASRLKKFLFSVGTCVRSFFYAGAVALLSVTMNIRS